MFIKYIIKNWIIGSCDSRVGLDIMGYRGVARFSIAVGLFLTRKSLSRHPAPMVQASRRFRAHASLVKVFLQKFFLLKPLKRHLVHS